MAPLRNSKAIPKVIDSVAQLLSLPFVLGEPSSVLDVIKDVYVDVKLVPNLMYASKLLLCHKSMNESTASHNIHSSVRAINELSSEEIRTASRLYELICHLVHLKQQFLLQFCDAVAILAANDLFISFLNHGKLKSFSIYTTFLTLLLIRLSKFQCCPYFKLCLGFILLRSARIARKRGVSGENSF